MNTEISDEHRNHFESEKQMGKVVKNGADILAVRRFGANEWTRGCGCSATTASTTTAAASAATTSSV